MDLFSFWSVAAPCYTLRSSRWIDKILWPRLATKYSYYRISLYISMTQPGLSQANTQLKLPRLSSPVCWARQLNCFLAFLRFENIRSHASEHKLDSAPNVILSSWLIQYRTLIALRSYWGCITEAVVTVPVKCVCTGCSQSACSEPFPTVLTNWPTLPAQYV